MADSPRTLVAVVLAYGGVEDARPLVLELAAMDAFADGRIILVHNPSVPGERAELDVPGVVVINNERNLGYAAGMNVGFAEATALGAEAIFTLTHEARLTEETVRALADALSGDAQLAAVGPVLRTRDGALLSAGMVRRGRSVRLTHRRAAAPPAGVLAPCESLDGSVVLWRAEVVRDLGGFDPRFFMYYEEIDLCARAWAAGMRVAVVGGVEATSVSGGSNRRTAHAYLTTRNSLAYARKRGGRFFVRWWFSLLWWVWVSSPKPGGERFRDPDARRTAVQIRRGAWRGARDYVKGRWGAPPVDLLRDSDIAATS